MSFTLQNSFSITNRKRKHDIEHNIDNFDNENDSIVDINLNFATFFARRLKVVNSFFTNVRKFKQVSRRLTFNSTKIKEKFRLTNENLNSLEKIKIKNHKIFVLK